MVCCLVCRKFVLCLYCLRSNRGMNDLVFSHKVVPILGAEFNVYTPVIIVVLCALTLWYSRILGLVGFEHEDLSYKGSAGYERLEEGRRAVEQDRRQSHLRGLWDDEEIHHSDLEIPEVHNNNFDL